VAFQAFRHVDAEEISDPFSNPPPFPVFVNGARPVSSLRAKKPPVGMNGTQRKRILDLGGESEALIGQRIGSLEFTVLPERTRREAGGRGGLVLVAEP
jgi:hypothetical protein